MSRAALLVLAACGGGPAAKPAVTPAQPAREVLGALMPNNILGRVELDGAPVTYFAIAYVRNFAGMTPVGSRFAIHNADGTFSASIPWGRWDLIIAAPGAARRIIPGVDIESKVVDLGTISLRAGHTITGIVTDEVGQPVADARVDFVNRMTFGRVDELDDLVEGNLSTRTDAGGHYAIHGASRELLGTGRPSLVATTPTRGMLPVDVPDADAKIDLQVVPTGTIAITVTGSTPEVVTASARGAVLYAMPHDGVWRFERVPVGAYSIDAHGVRMHTRAHQSVTVQPDGVASATLVMPALTPVEVAITSNKPVCTMIQLRDLDQREIAIAPCANRVATFPRLEPGTYLACIDRRDCSPIVVEDSPAQQKLDVPRP